MLAHQRFQADRAQFQGLDLAARFQRIHACNLWGAETSVSGLESELPAAAALRQELRALLAELGVHRLQDAPCGDAVWINSVVLPCAYVGVDIVPALIDALEAKGGYRLADLTRDPLP